MCLKTITKTKGIKDGYGYKIFSISNPKYIKCIYAWIYPKTNIWIKASENKPDFCNSGLVRVFKYNPGWHVYLNKSRALAHCRPYKKRVVRIVKYRNPIVMGNWEGASVVVAEEIRILKETK